MSKRNPNSEQLEAIEHSGGVLLRAGAGSGKTFVLVEHIVYLTRKWIAEYKKAPVGNLEEFIRSKFSQVVMMTFTKKAAGEMSIRLTDRFAELMETEADSEAWAIVGEALPTLTVTTIDGFCRKLITAGYFPSLSTEANIIFETERIDQVRGLLTHWFDKRSESFGPDILDIVIREKESLLSAMSSIFNDPGLRLSWRAFKIEDTDPGKLGALLTDSFKLGDIGRALAAILALEVPGVEKERSAFERFVATLQATGLPEVDSVEKLQIYTTLFEGKRLMPESSKDKKGLPGHVAAHEGQKKLRDWSVKWGKVTSLYSTHYQEKILPWLKLCQELYQWVDERLDPNQGMTFGDVAYYVAIGLEEKEIQERIHKTYRYFIVDEFQDTSALQFKIIQNLIAYDYNRLFCVGDAKQAIYGFRGGELSVFEDCGELVPQRLSLANNYRSLPEIIQFNNSLFKSILPLGQDFVGEDPFTVKPEDQNVPTEILATEKGRVEILNAELFWDGTAENKFSNDDINRLEAYVMASAIELDRSTKPQEVCTILYSKLKPSAELIKNLMHKKIGFTAQYKIDLLDDPIIGMFLGLLRRQFDSNESTRDKYPLFILKSYLKVLGLERDITQAHLEEFDLNVHYWGLLEAYRKFLHRLQISNENSDLNLGTIETISEIFHQDPESVMVQIKDGDNARISLELRSGENSHMVQIMSAHASKGLEFDIVYLGGIYTNGKSRNDGALFGQRPGSFNWYQDLSLRDKQPSPFYLYENELSAYKNFSEAKRLFYVACTRAKKKLSWVSFDIPEKGFSVPQNSWIDGLNAWFSHGMGPECAELVFTRKLEDFDAEAILKAAATPQLPLFFHDPVGIFSKGEGVSELAIASELSVTRLNSLVDCPRKFYFENILKLAGTKKVYAAPEPEEGEELATLIKSSSQRGTKIHELIAQGILHNFVVPREASGLGFAKPIGWALQELQKLREEFTFVPEKALKFEFFNFMISGTPDLYLLPDKSDQTAQIWDFKTGSITPAALGHYWVQLKVYTYALYALGMVDKSLSIETKLCFVDQEQILTEVFNWDAIQKDLFTLWSLQNKPWMTKTDHCSQCSYGDICPR